MKLIKYISAFLCFAAVTGCSAAGLPGKTEGQTSTEGFLTESKADAQKNVPQLNNIRNICRLATLKCYYHNVAKSNKSAGTGLAHIGEIDRVFWIDYTGTAEIGYDINKIKMTQEGSNITITLPPPTVTCTVEPSSWNENSYIISDDSMLPFRKNPITAQNQSDAINKAQEDMRLSVLNNPSLLASAETQAHELIENYIEQIGRLTNVEYNVIWETSE